MRMISSLLLFVFLLPRLACSIELKVLHRSFGSELRIADLIASDKARISVLEQRQQRELRSRKTRYLIENASNDFATELVSASSVGLGQYFVHLELGTPPQKLPLIVDTGSDLIWTRCTLPSASPSPSPALAPSPDVELGQEEPSFVPFNSSSFDTIPCSDANCALVPAPQPSACESGNPYQACDFAYSYNDRSSTTGTLARDAVTLHRNKNASANASRFDNITFGCASIVQGSSFSGAAGVLGLARGKLSLSSQLISPQLGGVFSYCLVDFFSTNASSSLAFGHPKPSLSYTPILKNSTTFYYISVRRVSVGGKTVPGIDGPRAWDMDASGGGGTIIDSGTTLTFLREPAYSRVISALTKRIKLPKLAFGSDNPFQICYNVSGLEDYHRSFPKLSISLDGGAKFRVPVTSSSGFNIIGNLLQRDFHFEFDLVKSRIGFEWSPCS